MIADYMPPPAGHPHDPRTPECDEDDATADVIDDVRQLLIMAEDEAFIGDLAKARQLLAEAHAYLGELVGAE